MTTKANRQEETLWRDLWASPQAVVWEDLGWVRVVARYTRLTVRAERRTATTALLAEVRQLEDRLGLNPMSMKRLAWEIAGEPVADHGPDDVVDLDAYRDRLG